MLTYTQLAYFDDLLVDCLIDRLYYWSKTRKVRDVHKQVRGIPKEKILEVLQQELISPFKHGKRPSLANAVERFVNFAAIKNYLLRFPDVSIKNDFERHVRRYLQIYSPECGFAVEVTDRYKSRSKNEESCIISRKAYKEGEEIKGLTGILVQLTEVEEKDLMASDDRDFSIINSSRSGGNCLMLGPARFVNHDCKSNAKFVTLGGGSGMRLSLHAKTPIKCGEQITVEYAQNYFGKNNRECLCATCESLGHNGFRTTDDFSDDDEFAADSSEISNSIDNKAKLTLSIDLDATSQSDISERSTPLFSGPPSDAESSSTSLEPETLREGSVERGRKLRSRKSTTEDLSIAHMFKALYNPSSQLQEAQQTAEIIKSQNIELLKLYYRRPFEHEGSERVTNCENCGVPVIHDYYDEERLSLRSMERLFCPRCYRHTVLYNAYWPSTVYQEEEIQQYESIAKRIQAENESSEEEDESDNEGAIVRRRKVKNKRVFLPAVPDEFLPKVPRRVSSWLAKRLADDGIDVDAELEKAKGPRPDEPRKRRKSAPPAETATEEELPIPKHKRVRKSLPWTVSSRIVTSRVRKPSRKLLESHDDI